jgi:hypothetical protein
MPGLADLQAKPQIASSSVGTLKSRVPSANVCLSIWATKQFGFTCQIKLQGPKFADFTDKQFHPQGVIRGHFLEAGSEDAAISGWSAESHPYLWGGTLLLTRRDGQWKPVWYKSAVITRSCVKAERPDGRELLICEHEDGGMGHRIHDIYALDLQHPSANTPALVRADSFDSDFCAEQQQRTDAIHWAPDRQSFSVVIRTTHWQLLEEGLCGPHPPKRPKLSLQIDFEVTNSGIRRL